jgi:sulfatase modifying factor 1
MKNQSWPILAVIMFIIIPWAFEFTVAGESIIPGDFEPDNDVDGADFAVLSAAWQTHSGEVGWNHVCDISDPNDGFIDMLDVLVFSRHWLANAPLGMVFIDAGEFEMGDHNDVGALDERPVHAVYVDSFCMDTYEVTNQQYCDYLNSALSDNLIEVGAGHVVYKFGDSEAYCDTYESPPLHESRILWDGNAFGVVSGKEDHPMARVTWYGAVAYCNWRSAQEGRPNCYDLSTWTCNFTTNSFRLPTEAEWEYAARGGLTYYKYPWGNDPNYSKANWIDSGDPYESGSYPYTTPVGYYQANGYGLYDMAGNVWEWCNDRYGDDYYSWSPYNNPRGPDTGSFRTYRGGDLQHNPLIARIAHRGRNAPQTKQSYGGFRTVVSF